MVVKSEKIFRFKKMQSIIDGRSDGFSRLTLVYRLKRTRRTSTCSVGV